MFFINLSSSRNMQNKHGAILRDDRNYEELLVTDEDEMNSFYCRRSKYSVLQLPFRVLSKAAATSKQVGGLPWNCTGKALSRAHP
jgi:hypothetical protein